MREALLVRPKISGVMATIDYSLGGGSGAIILLVALDHGDATWEQHHRLALTVSSEAGELDTLSVNSEVCNWPGFRRVRCNAFALVMDEGHTASEVQSRIDAIEGQLLTDTRRTAVVGVSTVDVWSALLHARGWSAVCTTGLVSRGQFFTYDLEFILPLERGKPTSNDGRIQLDPSGSDNQLLFEYADPDGIVQRWRLGEQVVLP